MQGKDSRQTSTLGRIWRKNERRVGEEKLRAGRRHVPGQSPACDPRTDLALFAAILNLPLTTMAESVEIPYHGMMHASDWYLREENVRRAITRVVDYHHGLALASAFDQSPPPCPMASVSSWRPSPCICSIPPGILAPGAA